MFLFTSGWRIGQTLSLTRDDLDLDGGFAIARAEDTKGKRDARIPLHPMAIEHLRTIEDFNPLVFMWSNGKSTLSKDFVRLKDAAGVKIKGRFHRLRSAFATYNAATLPADVLQTVMQHKAAATTRRYINQAERLRQTDVASRIHAPTLPIAKDAS